MINSIVGVVASSGNSFPLDVVPGAALAYSMKKLRSAYAGFAFKARRSSDNATTDVSFDNNTGGVSNNSSVSAGGTFGAWRGADTIFINTLYDQGTFGNNITQATLARQFVYIDNNYNGYPVIRSNNTPTPTYLQGSNTTLKNINSYSEYCKLNVDSGPGVGAANTILEGGGPVNLSGLFTSVKNSARFVYRSPYSNTGGDNTQSGTGVIPSATYFSFSAIRDSVANNSKVYKNGVVLATLTPLTAPAWPGTNMTMTMGANGGSLGSGSMNGYFFALISYPYALTTNQLAFLDNVL